MSATSLGPVCDQDSVMKFGFSRLQSRRVQDPATCRRPLASVCLWILTWSRLLWRRSALSADDTPSSCADSRRSGTSCSGGFCQCQSGRPRSSWADRHKSEDFPSRNDLRVQRSSVFLLSILRRNRRYLVEHASCIYITTTTATNASLKDWCMSPHSIAGPRIKVHQIREISIDWPDLYRCQMSSRSVKHCTSGQTLYEKSLTFFTPFSIVAPQGNPPPGLMFTKQ